MQLFSTLEDTHCGYFLPAGPSGLLLLSDNIGMTPLETCLPLIPF